MGEARASSMKPGKVALEDYLEIKYLCMGGIQSPAT
jgi:hypothetical protein